MKKISLRAVALALAAILILTILLIPALGDPTDTEPPTAVLTYNPSKENGPTGGSVTVTLTASEPITAVSPGTWAPTPDPSVWKKVFPMNAVHYVTFEDLAGNQNVQEVKAEVDWIDKISPTATLAYSPSDDNGPTNGYVTVTLTASDPIKNIAPGTWASTSDPAVWKKVFTANTVQEITITDLAGNTNTQEIKATISWIDKDAPTATFAYSNNNGNTPTNKDVTVTMTTSETIQTPIGWTKVDDTIFTKVFTDNMKFTVELKDLAGNEREAQGEVKRIDKIPPEGKIDYDWTKTSGKVVLTISVTDKPWSNVAYIQIDDLIVNWDKLPYDLEVDINTTGTVFISDKAGNVGFVDYNTWITPIDPVIETKKSSSKSSGTSSAKIIETNMNGEKNDTALEKNTPLSGMGTAIDLEENKKTMPIIPIIVGLTAVSLMLLFFIKRRRDQEEEE